MPRRQPTACLVLISCIPEDIHYIIKRVRQGGVDTRLLDDAVDLNDKMPHYAVRRLI